MQQAHGIPFFLKRVFGIMLGFCALVLVSWLMLTYSDFIRHRVHEDYSHEMGLFLAQIRETPASMQETELFPAAVDGFHVIGPYLPQEEQFERVGTKWYLSTSFSDHMFSGLFFDHASMEEGKQVLVFVSEGKPVGTAVLERMQGDFIGNDSHDYLAEELLQNSVRPHSTAYWHVSRAQ